VQQGCNLVADSKALIQQQQQQQQQQQLSGVRLTAAQASHATGTPLGEGLEDEMMFDYHHSNHMHYSAGSPLAREGSNMSDWQIKAGRTDSYLTRTRSSASLWHSEYQSVCMAANGVCDC
jgi:hypothetical protein